MASVVDWQGEFSYFPSYLAIDLDKALIKEASVAQTIFIKVPVIGGEKF